MSRPIGIPRAKRHYGGLYGVSAWIPSEGLVHAAHERTEGMVGYFLMCADRYQPGQWQNDLYTLARSAYLQGARDTADAAAQMLAAKDKEKRHG